MFHPLSLNIIARHIYMHPFSESFTMKMYAETGGELRYTMHLNPES
jgi:hypothetical protein